MHPRCARPQSHSYRPSCTQEPYLFSWLAASFTLATQVSTPSTAPKGEVFCSNRNDKTSAGPKTSSGTLEAESLAKSLNRVVAQLLFYTSRVSGCIVIGFIPGQPLDECWNGLPRDTQGKIAAQVAEIIQEMHPLSFYAWPHWWRSKSGSKKKD